MKRLINITSLWLLIFTLGGCGGGVSTPPAATTVNGVASKGPIVNGVVRIFAVANGEKGALLNQSRTDDKGNYSIEIGGYTGPVIVEASGDYTDEATGATKTIPADAPLRAALPSTQGTVSLPVTPLTELAVIKMGNVLSPAAISAANTLVSDLFKVDIIATLPVAPTAEALGNASQAQKDYTLALAAVSQMIKNSADAGGSDKLNDVLASVAQGISPSGMTTETVAAINMGMADFVSNSNNNTGITDTTATSLVNVGTLTKSYKLRLEGSFAPNSITGLQFVLALPDGVTLNVNSSTSAVLTSSLALPGSAPAGALLSAKSSASSLTVGILATDGFGVGELATLTCNIKAGATAPSAASFTVSNLKSIDKNAAAVTGASITVN